MNLEESAQEYANALLDALDVSGLETQLKDPQESFESGIYVGATQGFKRGINVMLEMAIESLPDIYNQIVESNFDMSIKWTEKYKELLFSKYFNIDNTNNKSHEDN